MLDSEGLNSELESNRRTALCNSDYSDYNEG